MSTTEPFAHRLLNFALSYPGVAFGFLLSLACAARWFILPADRKRTEWLLVGVMFANPLNNVAWGIATALSHVRPLKYDEFVYRVDRIFGEPSFLIGRLVQHNIALNILLNLTYNLLPFVIAGVCAVFLWGRSEQEALRVAVAFLLNLFSAVPVYLLFPVCGPRFAFPGFPFNNPIITTPHLLAINAAPNGVPSVHTSSALLILWFLREWRWGRRFGWAFLCLTILATLGLGEHYALVILAIPYAWAIQQFSRLVFYSEASTKECVETSAAR